MKRVLISLFLAFSFLFAATNSETFAKFDRNFMALNRSAKIKLHNDIKNIYVDAIIKNDKNTKKQALTRLITSSKALGFDSSAYIRDLNAINGVKGASAQAILPALTLLSATKVNDTLVLKFNTKLDTARLKTSFAKQQNAYKNIMDIDGRLNGNPLTYKNFISDYIHISQYDKNTVRIIFSDKVQKTIKANATGDLLIISAQNFISNENVRAPLHKNKKEEAKPKEPEPNLKSEPAQSEPVEEPLPPVVTGKFSRNKTIVIDPGHGGTDPGAVNGSLKEKTAVLGVAKKLGEILKSRGYKVYFTRSTDVFINLRSRTKFANDKMADLFVSIHANAAPNAAKAKSMHGIETFFLSPARSERSKNAAALENKSDIEEMNYFSQQTFLNVLNREKIIASNKLGIDIQKDILASARKVYAASDGSVREAPFWVLVGALMPAVLVEIGYITHPVEGEKLFNEAYQKALANGIANGIDGYFAKNR
ncbi:N-acetylmuramoyl-L-alanine amidase family protein [Campylobacter concisus]|uniref:N-acetylmuramoyl-L-alanine amidase n=1 Tax=Campylobacter concisus (strain 13826) TaxID=360104 RepID=A7ZEX9_CAMC1|nr:N-acetylmuramoyl-L-alanine amidase [Campylobacter concisus]EAT99308.1 N-acetylmuramoyl-L-alanine amidase [Campylobacter concisus 13826]